MRAHFPRADIHPFDYEAYFLRQVYLHMGCCWDEDATANRSVTLRGQNMVMVALYMMMLRIRPTSDYLATLSRKRRRHRAPRYDRHRLVIDIGLGDHSKVLGRELKLVIDGVDLPHCTSASLSCNQGSTCRR